MWNPEADRKKKKTLAIGGWQGLLLSFRIRKEISFIPVPAVVQSENQSFVWFINKLSDLVSFPNIFFIYYYFFFVPLAKSV